MEIITNKIKINNLFTEYYYLFDIKLTTYLLIRVIFCVKRRSITLPISTYKISIKQNLRFFVKFEGIRSVINQKKNSIL